MDADRAEPLLGGLTPRRFMREHWQRRPLLVRGAWPDIVPPLDRTELFALAAGDDVESRLVRRYPRGRWTLRHGPVQRRAMPPLQHAGWTLLVQGLDLHVDAAHAMLRRFDFVPYARLDDLMVSWASDGGGVGPHVDAYDVFLIQIQGRRRWRVGPVHDPALVPGVPLKLLANFEPEHDWLLEPGDLLYLPPGWGHDGAAVGGDCMTASVGFRAPARGELARLLLARMADAEVDDAPAGDARYADRGSLAAAAPAAVPEALKAFAADAVRRALAAPRAIETALGEWLTEPKPQVWFPASASRLAPGQGVRLDRRSRMLYDSRMLFLNGESWRAGGRDARLLRRLADRRRLDAGDVARLGADARAALDRWVADGWLHAVAAGSDA